MEMIELYDPSINKLLKVKVPFAIAERCRKNAEFAQALFEEIQKENIQDGSVLDVATTDMDDEESPNEASDDLSKECWSSEETLKLLETLKKHRQSLKSNMSNEEEMKIWQTVSKDLASVGISKDANKCKSAWNKAQKSYSTVKDQPETKYQYFQEVSAILDDSQVESDESDVDNSVSISELMNFQNSRSDREIWTRYETLKFLKIFQNLKRECKIQNPDKQYWLTLSQELGKFGIVKDYKKCMSKWKNLKKTYKTIQMRSHTSQKFLYRQQMEDLMNDVDLKEPHKVKLEDTLGDTEEDEFYIEDGNLDCKRLKMEEDMEEEDPHLPNAYWLDKETTTLIEAYKKHKHKFKLLTTKKTWEIISAELASHGIIKDAERCRNKWKNLKRSYKTNRLMNSSASKKFYFKDEMEEVLDGESDNKRNGNGVANAKVEDSDDEMMKRTIDGLLDKKSFGNDVKENDSADDDELRWEDANKGKDISWSRSDTIALIDAYREHKETFNKTADKPIDWKEIATSLGAKKTSEQCQKKWSTLYKDYVANKYKLGEGSFAFQAEIDAVFETKNSAEVKASHCDKCRCCEKKMADKQKRHTERMNLLKTRLDVEQRKVLAFEKYLNSIV